MSRCKDKIGEICQNKECRQWIDYSEDDNCVLVAVKKNGKMTLRECAKRLGVSYVRVKQIEDKAVKKLEKKLLSS
jgi:transcriptional regulator with XRE-family HTH domain